MILIGCEWLMCCSKFCGVCVVEKRADGVKVLGVSFISCLADFSIPMCACYYLENNFNLFLLVSCCFVLFLCVFVFREGGKQSRFGGVTRFENLAGKMTRK